MTRTSAPPPDTPLAIPDPDLIRAAIDAADERARLLRRLLRLVLRLRVHLSTADQHVPPAGRQGAARG